MEAELTAAQLDILQDREQKIVEYLCNHYPPDLNFEIEFAPATLLHYLTGCCEIAVMTFWGNIPSPANLRIPLVTRLRMRDTLQVYLLGPDVILYPKRGNDGD
jgi:hypothetical protein